MILEIALLLALIIVVCGFRWSMRWLTIAQNKEMNHSSKTLQEEIKALEIDLGVYEPAPGESILDKGVGGNGEPKWRIWKSGGVWMLGREGERNLGFVSFESARRYYIEYATEEREPRTPPPRGPSAVSKPKGSHYTLPKGPGPAGKRPSYTAREAEVLRSMEFACGGVRPL